ncbi:putative lipoprotein [Bordetella bronchiseptica]|nr:putative lipoprotein [Bordetella bronchiseptica]
MPVAQRQIVQPGALRSGAIGLAASACSGSRSATLPCASPTRTRPAALSMVSNAAVTSS